MARSNHENSAPGNRRPGFRLLRVRKPITGKPGERAKRSGLWVSMPHSLKERTVAKGKKLPPTPLPGEWWELRIGANNKSGGGRQAA